MRRAAQQREVYKCMSLKKKKIMMMLILLYIHSIHSLMKKNKKIQANEALWLQHGAAGSMEERDDA